MRAPRDSAPGLLSGVKRACILMACTVLTQGMPFAAAPENTTRLLFVGDFEQANSLNALGDTDLEQTLGKVKVVSQPVRHGSGALKLTLQREAPGDLKAYRTDFWIRGMSEVFQMGGEYWYGFSTMLPDDFQPDELGELFVQWINPKVGGSPSLAIYLYEDSYQIRKRSGEGNTIHRALWRGSVSRDLGEWVDWVFRVRWSDGMDGLVEAWKNGQLIISDAGPNTARAGDLAPYFKFGIYKFPWRQSSQEAPSPVTRRTLYVDEIRIGSADAGYETVAPPQRVNSDR
jgi:hypothetical protein